MNLVTYATNQMEMVPSLAGTMTFKTLVESMQILDNQGHSGSSMNYLLGMVKLASEHDDPHQFAFDDFTSRGWMTQKPSTGDEQKDWESNMQFHICTDILEVLKSLTDNIKTHSLDKDSVFSNFLLLAAYEPIVPITNEPSDWHSTGDNSFQHRYMSSIFKNGVDGRPYYLDGVVFRMESGSTWTSGDSKMYVNLPCMATDLTRHYINVDEEDRCVDEQEFLKYLVLAESMVHPRADSRKPKSML